MINIVSGGSLHNKGYSYKVYLTIPEFKVFRPKCVFRDGYRLYKFSLPTKFCLTEDKNYINMVFSILGFGLGIELRIKNEPFKGELSE